MPQGLQVFDSSGTLILDTSTSVLKAVAFINVTASNTTNNSVSVATPANTRVTVVAIPNAGPSGDTTIPSVSYNVATDTLSYQWPSTGGGKAAKIAALMY